MWSLPMLSAREKLTPSVLFFAIAILSMAEKFGSWLCQVENRFNKP